MPSVYFIVKLSELGFLEPFWLLPFSFDYGYLWITPWRNGMQRFYLFHKQNAIRSFSCRDTLNLRAVLSEPQVEVSAPTLRDINSSSTVMVWDRIGRKGWKCKPPSGISKKIILFSRRRKSLFLLCIHFHSPLQMFMSLGLNIELTICVTELKIHLRERKTNIWLVLQWKINCLPVKCGDWILFPVVVLQSLVLLHITVQNPANF